MKLLKKSKGDTYHFVIFDRETDEEGVLTFTKLLLSINVRVTLFLSEKILTLIGYKLKELEVDIFVLQKDLDMSLQQINKFLEVNQIDLIYFPYFDAVSSHEVTLYIRFIKQQPVYVHINSYNRWLSTFPPITFHRWKIMDWFFL